MSRNHLTIGSTRRDYRWDFIVTLVTPLVNLIVICDTELRLLEYIKRFFKGIAFALDALDFIALCFVASLIFFSVPFYIVKKLYQSGNLLLSTVIVLVFVSSFCVCIRDYKKKKWSALSICIVSMWAVCAFIAAWLLMS